MFTDIYDWRFSSTRISMWFLIFACSLPMPLIVKSHSLNLTSTFVNQNESKNHQQSLNRNRVVVFDIDGTLCKTIEFLTTNESQYHVKCAREYHPECPIIEWKNDTMEYHGIHVFLPYWQVLFGYLLQQSTRIVFFSGGLKDRNVDVIPALLTSFWGKEKFEALRVKGQFNIHSTDDMRRGELRGEGNYVKDFKAVIRDGELLSNVILVDDDWSYPAYDQQPYISFPDISFGWNTCERDHDGYKNLVFYILGLFKTYFENDKYNELPLREAFVQILPEIYKYYNDITENETFKLNMMYLGLSEVQKQIPDARFYTPNITKELYHSLRLDW